MCVILDIFYIRNCSVFLFSSIVFLCLYVCFSVCVCVCLSFCMCICLFVCFFVYMCVHKSGMRVGDRIVSIDDTDIRKLPVDKVSILSN